MGDYCLLHLNVIDSPISRAKLVLDAALLAQDLSLYPLGGVCNFMGRHPSAPQMIQRADQCHADCCRGAG